MSLARHKIPLIALGILSFAKFMVMLLSKEPIYDALGGLSIFLMAGAQSALGLWAVLLASGIVLMFYGQSLNLEVTVPAILGLAFIFEVVNWWFSNMPNA